MKKTYMLGGLRSHIGVRNGIFKDVPAEKLAAAVLTALKENTLPWKMSRNSSPAMPSERAATSPVWQG